MTEETAITLEERLQDVWAKWTEYAVQKELVDPLLDTHATQLETMRRRHEQELANLKAQFESRNAYSLSVLEVSKDLYESARDKLLADYQSLYQMYPNSTAKTAYNGAVKIRELTNLIIDDEDSTRLWLLNYHPTLLRHVVDRIELRKAMTQAYQPLSDVPGARLETEIKSYFYPEKLGASDVEITNE